MNIPSGLRIFPALFFASQSIQPTLAATNQYWNPSGGSGDGIWGTTPGDKNWNTSPGAPAGNTFWQDGADDVAVFQSAAGGIVTVFDPVQTTGIILDGADYTINASTITLAPDSTASTPFIQVDGKGARLTIDSILDGGSGLIKNGRGGLVLTGDNLYSGSTVVADGELILEGSLTSNVINISNVSQLRNQSGGLPDDTILTNAGLLSINGVSETISSYTANSGLLSSSDGKTLFTNTTALNGDSQITSSLHADTFTTTGNASIISGSVTAGTSRIDSGVLTLGGILSTPSLTIAPGGTLIDSATGSLNDDMILTNSGDLQVVGQRETIGTYRSNSGTLMASSGTLVASDAELNNGSLVAGNLVATHLTNSGSVEISGQVIADSALIRVGTLTLSSGQLISPDIEIENSRSSLINQSGGFADSTVLTNNGRLTMEVDDTVANYISKDGRLLDGAGTLFVDVTELTGNATIFGNLNTGSLDIYDTGRSVVISGIVETNRAVISSGKLDLIGQLVSPTLEIATNAEVASSGRGLPSNMVLTNAGTLYILEQDTISSYISNGGILSPFLTVPGGTLITTTAELNDGSHIESNLTTDTLFSNGAVLISGAAAATTIQINSGQLTNTGTLGTPNSSIDIRGGAALVASGTQRYSLLTTSGTTPGLWVGNLLNPASIAPGGQSGIGSLAVTGDFANTSTANLHFEVGGMRNDHIMVSGNAHFDGALDLIQRGSPTFSPLSPINLVSAASYSGNITSLTESLDGAVWFNPGNGNLNLLGNLTGPNGALAGASPNQTSTWLALYDDVIDPGSSNVTTIPGFNPGYDITSGIADNSNPDLLWALDASFTPVGINGAMLNRLSPAVYVGFEDYAIQATRTYQRTALSAPPLSSSPAVQRDRKAGAKNSDLGPTPFDWELFAAVDFFNVDTGTAANQADYQLNSAGFIAGARAQATEDIQIAAYLAFDDGSIKGSLIDADGTGWSIGLLGQIMLEELTETRVSGGISFGSYHFNGNRTSVSATSTGWAAGPVGFSEVNSNSLELFVSIERILYQDERIRVIPSAGLRFASGKLDSFSEFTSTTPGSPIALIAGGDSYHSALAEFSLLAEAKLTHQLTLQGLLGINASLGDDQRTVNARFAQSGASGRQIIGTSDGLTDSSVVLGLGAIHQFTDTLSAALSYRAEFRDNSDSQHGVSLSSSFRF